MHRRNFLVASIAASALAVSSRTHAQTSPGISVSANTDAREFYLLRRYTMRTGPQTALAESFFAGALLPALNRLGHSPVGAFNLDIGPQTPAFYLLVPGSSAERLATLDLRLAQDTAFLGAAKSFWNAPAAAPSFDRVEASLHVAFHGWSRLTPPAGRGPRIFQLRTYESPSYADHALKVQMFHSGEFDFFRNAGFHPVFFGDTLVGPRQPSLTYMLSFTDITELTAQWKTFSSNPAWLKLRNSTQYGSEAIVSNISNLILRPLACSQI